MHDHQHLFSWFEDVLLTHRLSASSHVLCRLGKLSASSSSKSLGVFTTLSQYFIALSEFLEAKLSVAPKIFLSRFWTPLPYRTFPASLGRLVQDDRDWFQTNLFITEVSWCLNDCFFSLYICTNVSAVLLKSGCFLFSDCSAICCLKA